MIKKLKKSIVTLAVGASLFSSVSVMAAGGSTSWNGGTFRWGLGTELAWNGLAAVATTSLNPNNNSRLVTTVEIHNASGLVNRDVGVAIASTGVFSAGRVAYGSHEARGASSIVRYTTIRHN